MLLRAIVLSIVVSIDAWIPLPYVNYLRGGGEGAAGASKGGRRTELDWSSSWPFSSSSIPSEDKITAIRCYRDIKRSRRRARHHLFVTYSTATSSAPSPATTSGFNINHEPENDLIIEKEEEDSVVKEVLEGEEEAEIIVDDIVTRIELTDWMSEGEDFWKGNPSYARRKFKQEEVVGEVRSTRVASGDDGTAATGHESSSGSTATGMTRIAPESLPVKIQREANLVWYEIQQKNRMDYLPSEEIARLKSMLVILIAFRVLFDHPNQVLNNRSAEECFRVADVNNDGQLSFEEFLKWYRRSQDGGGPTASAATTVSSSTVKEKGRSRSTALAPAGTLLEEVSMTDLLRQFLVEKERQGAGTKAGGGKERSEKQVLEDMDRCIETTQILLDLQADADTVLAALSMHFLGIAGDQRLQKLSVVRRQCGPIVHQIVEDSSRLGGLFQAPPEVQQFRRNARDYQAMLDLDHHNAKLAREYLLAANSDARAFVVHMAGLVYVLRNQYYIPVHQRHLIALESLQLYVPVAHALGLGSKLKEMEELSYKALFPDSYDKFATWHKSFADMGTVALVVARDRISQQIENHPHIRQHLEHYEIQGRVKSVVSAFKKVFRKDKLPEELHDMLGLRIILRVRAATRLLMRQLSSPAASKGAFPATISSSRERNSGNAAVAESSRGRNIRSAAVADSLAAAAAIVEGKREEVEEEEMITTAAAVIEEQENEEEEIVIRGDLADLPTPEGVDAWVCHRVHELVTDMWEEVPGRYKNYIDFPKPNGYQSIHTGVYMMDGGGTAEIQIRTDDMHREAEEGTASHALYKGEITTLGEGESFNDHQGSSHQQQQDRITKKEETKEAKLLPSSSLSSSADAASGITVSSKSLEMEEVRRVRKDGKEGGG